MKKFRRLGIGSVAAASAILLAGTSNADALACSRWVADGVTVYGTDSVSGKYVTSSTSAPGKLNGCNSRVRSVKVTIKGPEGSITKSSLIGTCRVQTRLWSSNPWATKTTHSVRLWSGATYSWSD